MNAEDFVIPFGKHSGSTLGWILEHDAGYIGWLYNDADIRSPALADAVNEVYEDNADRIDAAEKFRRAER